MDLNRVAAVILAGGKGQRLEPLTRDRAKPAVPFGGIYRIIDFALSNCVNAGLKKISVLVQYRSRSLNRHIRDGWQIMFNPAVGEYLETLPPQYHAGDSYLGTADAVYQNLFAVKEDEPEAILILAGDHIYKMDYSNMLADLRAKGADCIVACVEVPIEQASEFGIMKVDQSMRIVDFLEKPDAPPAIDGKPDRALASMGIYLFNRDTLIETLSEKIRSFRKLDLLRALETELIPAGPINELHEVFADPHVMARELVGHESAAISRQYTHLSTDDLRSAMQRLPDVTDQ
jgi:glucose-1-phosphate adenylyltransferase